MTYEEYLRLVDELNHHCVRYYLLNDPIISDKDYDELYRRLLEYERLNPDKIVPDSPSRRVGFKVEGGKTIRHEIKMLSLDNVYNSFELEDFIQKVLKNLKSEPLWTVEPKIDGAAVSIIYEDGVLRAAISRGDGIEGEDITHTVRTIKSLPVRIPDNSRIVARGEVFLSKENFNKINQERGRLGEPLFANPRNAAAGTLKLLDPEIAASRGLDIFIYALDYGRKFDSHYKDLQYLKGIGFPINEYVVLVETKDIFERISFIENIKRDLSYEIDGVVIKVDSYSDRDTLGETIKYPRWAVAYKFEAEQVTTKLLDVIFQVGRTGIVTPVAVLEPVHISGSTISKASLHNEDEIKRLGVKIGDYVFVEKSGEIIPKVIKVIPERRVGVERSIVFPEFCPSCNNRLVKIDAYWKCLNENCPDRIKGAIVHYASRDAMDIKGFGEKSVDKFYETGLVRSISDIYRLKKGDIHWMEGFGELSEDNILRSIEESKNREFYRFIYALGIENTGIKTAQLLASKFSNIDNLMNARYYDIVDIHGIGDEIARSIVDYFSKDEVRKMIDFLKMNGVNMEQQKAQGKLNGLTFLITGTLSKPRKYFEDLIIKNGGTIASSVSKKLNYLIVGENPGSKLEKAKSLGIMVIDEDAFIKMIGE